MKGSSSLDLFGFVGPLDDIKQTETIYPLKKIHSCTHIQQFGLVTSNLKLRTFNVGVRTNKSIFINSCALLRALVMQY